MPKQLRTNWEQAYVQLDVSAVAVHRASPCVLLASSLTDKFEFGGYQEVLTRFGVSTKQSPYTHCVLSLMWRNSLRSSTTLNTLWINWDVSSELWARLFHPNIGSLTSLMLFWLRGHKFHFHSPRPTLYHSTILQLVLLMTTITTTSYKS